MEQEFMSVLTDTKQKHIEKQKKIMKNYSSKIEAIKKSFKKFNLKLTLTFGI